MTLVLSKLLWALIAPGSLLVFALAVGVILAATTNVGWARAGRILCVSVAICLVVIAVLPVGDWALTPLESRFAFAPPDQIDGIIVIGGDEKTEVSESRGIPVALDSMRRYMTFVDLARRYPDSRLVFSGGSVFPRPHARLQDSDIARQMIVDMGVPEDRLLIEKNSRNTYENAEFSADIVRPLPTQKWLLVTSAWHMPRAMGCFRKAGWNIYAAPTGYFTTGRYRLHGAGHFDEQLHELTLAMHEYVGLVSYWLMGRTSALWPQ